MRTSGTCSQGATWKLKAKTDDGRLEVELEVDSNRVGQSWSVRLKDNGVLVWSGTRTTLAPSGSFEVERRIANRAGTDTITAYARHAASGQTCSARLVIPRLTPSDTLPPERTPPCAVSSSPSSPASPSPSRRSSACSATPRSPSDCRCARPRATATVRRRPRARAPRRARPRVPPSSGDDHGGDRPPGVSDDEPGDDHGGDRPRTGDDNLRPRLGRRLEQLGRRLGQLGPRLRLRRLRATARATTAPTTPRATARAATTPTTRPTTTAAHSGSESGDDSGGHGSDD